MRDAEGVADLVGDGVGQGEAVVLVDGARAGARFADGTQLRCERISNYSSSDKRDINTILIIHDYSIILKID